MKNSKNLKKSPLKPRVPTKEELNLALMNALSDIQSTQSKDEHRRREFAKAFNWVKNARYSEFNNHIEKEPQLPTWEQIFVHIGKLLVLEELKQKIVPSISNKVE